MSGPDVSPEQRALLERTYEVFNARDLDGTLAVLSRDVQWPNGMEGGYLTGHDAVRAYWTRQWTMIDPHVEPEGFTLESDGRVSVAVHQVVRDLEGNLRVDVHIEHVYTIEDGLVTHMEIRGR